MSTSVLSVVLFLCLVLGLPSWAGDYEHAYNDCLREERAKRVSEQCREEADSGGDAAHASCLAGLKPVTIPQIVIDACVAKAKMQYGEAAKEEKLDTDFNTERPGIMADDGTGSSSKWPPPKARPASPAVAADKKDPAADEPSKPAAAKAPTPKKDSPQDAFNNETPTQAPSQQRIEDTSMAEIEADMDVARCVTAQSNANECCNNPMSCSGRLDATDSSSLNNLNNALRNGPSSGGLTGYCQQMNNLGYNTGNVNSGLSAACFGSHSSCSTTCRGLSRKYSELLSSCNGCAAEWIYRNAVMNLTSGQNSCDNLQSRSNQLAATGLGTANNQALANYCSQVSGAATPSSTSGSLAPTATSPYINNLLAQNCEAYPNSPDCRSINPKLGKVGYETGGSGKSFNVGSTYGSGTETQAPEGRTGGGAAAKAGATPPNNTGGPIPQSATQAQLQNGGPRGTMPQGQGTDVDRGFLAANGGYSQPNDRDSDSLSGYIPMGSSGSQFEAGVDLRQFLPGGSRAAGRKLAGMGQINAKEENIFIRITNKMMEKCRLGILWQCR